MNMPDIFNTAETLYNKIEAEFSEQSAYVRSGNFSSKYSDAIDKYGFNSVKTFIPTVLMILKPDLIAADRLKETISWLEVRKIQIANLQLLPKLSEPDLEEIYRYNLSYESTSSMISNWWLFRRAYELHPQTSVALYLRKESASPFSLYREIKESKGPSTPYWCEPGHLRHDLGASARTLNLVHTCDDPIDAIRVSEILLGRKAYEVVRQINELCSTGQSGFQNAHAYFRDVILRLRAVSDTPLKRLNFGTIFLKLASNAAFKQMVSQDHAGNFLIDRDTFDHIADSPNAVEALTRVREYLRSPSGQNLKTFSSDELVNYRAILNFSRKEEDKQGLSNLPNVFYFSLNEHEKYLLKSTLYFADDLNTIDVA
ncbi:hypothetical protein LJR231_002770 [Phyllobacterium sp. LjRoot231]|uniref:hypothetical protein n=1 Tax=Phyllobacterium sp. LjRoot231 TaxID=3342289 RepID=UPI003ECC48FA